MPFNIVRYKRGWRVKDDKGNYYSKKPLTKKNARQQQKALYASESRRQFISGEGYASYVDDDNIHHIILVGDGFFGNVWAKIKQVGNYVQKALVPAVAPALRITSDIVGKEVRTDYPPKVRDILNRYGAGVVYKLIIVREPIQNYINDALNFITRGKWNEAKKELNYDKLFHLSMIAFLSMPNGDRAEIKIEKNEVINITDSFTLKVPGVSGGVSRHGSGRDADIMPVPITCCITLFELLNNALQQVGNDFFKYDAFNNNCQKFILDILRANSILTPEINAFVNQNVEQLLQKLPGYTAPFASLITNIAGLANRVMYGNGVEGGCIECMEAKGNRCAFRGGVKLSIDTSAEPIHKTSLSTDKINKLKGELEIDYDDTKDNQYKQIEEILDYLLGDKSFLQNEYDITEIENAKSVIKKRQSKPYEFVSVIEKVLDRLQPTKLEGGNLQNDAALVLDELDYLMNEENDNPGYFDIEDELDDIIERIESPEIIDLLQYIRDNLDRFPTFNNIYDMVSNTLLAEYGITYVPGADNEEEEEEEEFPIEDAFQFQAPLQYFPDEDESEGEDPDLVNYPVSNRSSPSTYPRTITPESIGNPFNYYDSNRSSPTSNPDIEGGVKLYCGKKEAPRGKVKGTLFQCFKKGIGVGMMLEKSKPVPQKALNEMTIRELGQLASQLKIPGYGRMKKQELIDAIQPLRGSGNEAELVNRYLQPDGSWTGSLAEWSEAGHPGCGPGYEYNPDSGCYENCFNKDESFSCNAKSVAQKKKEDLERYKDKAQIRTANQDEDTMKRFFSLENIKREEQEAKDVAKQSEIPPVPKLNDIPEYRADMATSPGNPSTYTGFAKMGDNVMYFKNGIVIRTGLKAGATVKYNFDWKKVEDRWNRLQEYDPTRPGEFTTLRKDKSLVTYDKYGREKFDVNRHGNIEWLNSVEGRHIREADPYFEELYQRLKEHDHAYNGRSEGEIKNKEEELEKNYQDEVKARYGDNEDIFSPEAGFTLTDKKGNKQRVNKVRLRKDGGYDIQFANGTWEYQAGEDEWDCNEWKKGSRIENYGVCGTDGRKKASELIAKNINRERDQQWDSMSGWDKFVNGLNVAGAFTQDYILPVASVVANFIPGVGQAISTGLDIASNVADMAIGDNCRHFNECTKQEIEKKQAEALYHRTKGDSVAERYLGDENWMKLLEANKKAYGLVGDTVNYGSRAGKFYQTGEGKPANEPMSALRKQLKQEGITPKKYLEVVRDIAEEEGYDGRAIEFSDDPEKKLMIYDDEGKKRYFGAVGYGDYILWSQQEALGKAKKGFADMKRRVFQKSHNKIRGDWKSDKFSPNSLSLNILWSMKA